MHARRQAAASESARGAESVRPKLAGGGQERRATGGIVAAAAAASTWRCARNEPQQSRKGLRVVAGVAVTNYERRTRSHAPKVCVCVCVRVRNR